MSVNDKKNTGSAVPNRGTNTPARQGKTDERDVGAALRVAYQATVEETIPSEMLDLLGKLS